MPKQRRVIPIYGSLPAADAVRLKARAVLVKGTEASLVREAVLFYLDHQEKEKENRKETMLEKRMQRMEDRLAAILAKTAIDVGVIYSLLWQNANYKTRDEQFIRARKHSIDRLRKKWNSEEMEIKEAV